VNGRISCVKELYSCGALLQSRKSCYADIHKSHVIRLTYTWVTAHTRDTDDESCQETYSNYNGCLCMSHGTRTAVFDDGDSIGGISQEWVMSHVWVSHVTHMCEPRHTYQWVMSHVSISHVTRINQSCHTRTAVFHEGASIGGILSLLPTARIANAFCAHLCFKHVCEHVISVLYIHKRIYLSIYIHT